LHLSFPALLWIIRHEIKKDNLLLFFCECTIYHTLKWEYIHTFTPAMCSWKYCNFATSQCDIIIAQTNIPYLQCIYHSFAIGMNRVGPYLIYRLTSLLFVSCLYTTNASLASNGIISFFRIDWYAIVFRNITHGLKIKIMKV
jgi:hypothetical protein